MFCFVEKYEIIKERYVILLLSKSKFFIWA